MTMQQFVEANGISMTTEYASENPNMDDRGANSDNYKCVLRHAGRQMTVYFSMGVGLGGRNPEPWDVLNCIADDSAGVENADSFEDWAEEYGYDTDSRRAERTYRVCEKQSEKLKRFLGDEQYNALLWDVERL